MAQTASVPVPAGPAAHSLPLESFLATDDPVWVWDGQGRRILWANSAAAKLWGDPTPERLMRRRTGKAPRAPARLTTLARSDEVLGEHSETVRVPSPEGEVAVACVFQRLQLAGDRPGLVVRVVSETHEAETPAEIAMLPAAETTDKPQNAPANRQQPTPRSRKSATRSEIGALKAIARDLGDAKAAARASEADPGKPNAASHLKSRKAPVNESFSRRTKPKHPRTSGESSPEPTAPSSAELATLLARVSHEIRNPLTIILGFAEILQSDRMDRLPPGKAKEYASDIYRTAHLALGLADDLLGFAERASGEPPPPHDWVDLNAVIADCLHLLEPVATAQNVALVRRLSRDAPVLLAHERSMRQVLLNLLMNALRHGDGGGKIRVMTRIDREGRLIVSVKDDGPGMTPEQIAAAKTPEQARDVKQAGRRGLGLRLVLGFVRDNHGEIDIISKPGEGADVRIRFGPDRLRARKAHVAGKQPRKKAKPAAKTRPTGAATKGAAPKKQAAKKAPRERA